MGRPETRTNFLGLLVPKMNRPRNTVSLHWYIPIFLITYMYCIMHIMTGTYHSWDIVCSRTINLGTRGLRKFARGHIVSGRPITPPYKYSLWFESYNLLLINLKENNQIIHWCPLGLPVLPLPVCDPFPVIDHVGCSRLCLRTQHSERSNLVKNWNKIK